MNCDHTPVTDAVISLKNVWVRYDSTVILEDITLSIGPRQIVSIAGPNGSGKTTLLKVIMGLKEPSSGEITVLGHKPDAIQKTGLIGYLPQETRHEDRFPLSVFDVVAMSRYARKGMIERLNRDDRAAINESLDKVEMADHRDKHFGSLSGGQKQRVLIARALALGPRLLLLDEPSTGLDAVAQDGFYQLLRRLRDSQGLSILLVSHDIGTVSTVVDTIACIKRRIHFHGKPAECMDADKLAEVFGTHTYFLHHDKNCATCQGDHD